MSHSKSATNSTGPLKVAVDPDECHAQRPAGVFDDHVTAAKSRVSRNHGDGTRPRPARLRPAHPALDHANAQMILSEHRQKLHVRPSHLGGELFGQLLARGGTPVGVIQDHDVRIADVGEAQRSFECFAHRHLTHRDAAVPRGAVHL